jgi:hypothetical protein
LAEEARIRIDIDQCFSLLHPQTVPYFAMDKRVHAPISFARRC